MSRELKICIGQFSDRGRKEINQDFHGILVPQEPLLSMKGIAIAIADGVSSSSVSQIASESAVKSFLTDYYCTSDSWSVKTSGVRVISAVNAWLHAQTRSGPYRYDAERGYVCTFSALVLKSRMAHIFHVGDARICRLAGQTLEPLTEDHRVIVSADQSYLGRALGAAPRVEIDYSSFPVSVGDVFVIATDGAYEFADSRTIASIIHENAENLDAAARIIVESAYKKGSYDNITVQVVRVDALPDAAAAEVYTQGAELPLPPLPAEGAIFDGFRILRELHANSRSHIYLAVDEASGERVALKLPSVDLRGDAAYLKRFVMEEWAARRIDSPRVMKAALPARKRSYLYLICEYVEGQTLAQWMRDHPQPELESVRNIVEQIGAGVQAMHRKEMLHQDLRPQNILINGDGGVKIVDFGSARIAGVAEAGPVAGGEPILGTLQYTAPEYFLGDGGTPRSDLFSLAAITYEMLTGRLPYGVEASRLTTRAQVRKLEYETAMADNRVLPVWIDAVLRKGLDPDPNRRQQEVTQFTWELRHPREEYLRERSRPWLERNPAQFWKVFCLAFALVNAVLLARLWR